MKANFTVTCLQTNSSERPEKNIKMLEQAFSRPQVQDSDLICLPECVAIFSDSKKKINDFNDNWYQVFLNFISKKAKKMNSFVLIGSLPHKKKNNKFLNRSILVNNLGEVISYYDKINLFDVYLDKNEKYLESKNYDAGKSLSLANLPWGKLGLSICYDLRFPGLYKRLAKKGAIFLTIPAAFTFTTGKSHWHALIRARAIENGCYVFAPAQCGIHENGRRTYGHSIIVNPWGEIIAQAGEKVSSINALINIRDIEDARRKIPSMTNYKF